MNAKPNFLLAGAPKSGTTSLANYLRSHPGIFFSLIKEPFYWASDFPSLRHKAGVDNEATYLALFKDATATQTAIGEGSTLYLYSQTAIRDAIAWQPSMKFVFMLRRPSQIAQAFHMQMRFHEAENIEDFQQAWEIENERRLNPSKLAKRCLEPKLVQYSQVAAIGSQLERAMQLIPRDQMHVILFDDFAANTASSYKGVLEFLNLEDDNRAEFPKDNSAMVAKSAVVTRALRSRVVVDTSLWLKRRLRGKLFTFAKNFKHSLMFRNAPRVAIDPAFDAKLHEFFVPEVELLESLLKRDLSSWKRPVMKQ